jgi:hypothetical protein
VLCLGNFWPLSFSAVYALPFLPLQMAATLWLVYLLISTLVYIHRQVMLDRCLL